MENTANSNKKKSLFSQKIKQARQKQCNKGSKSEMEGSLNNQDQQNKNNIIANKHMYQQAPFPKAIKIDLSPALIIQQQHFSKQEQSLKQVKQNIKVSNVQNSVQPLQTSVGEVSFVDHLLNKQLKKQQIEQIQSENMKTLNHMSQQQINKYKQLLTTQLSPAFLNKLKNKIVGDKIKVFKQETRSNEVESKYQQQRRLEDNYYNGISQQIQQMQEQMNQNTKINDQSEPQPISNKDNRHNDLTPKGTNIQNNQDYQMKDQSIKQQQENKQAQGKTNIGILQKLYINIKKNSVQYNHSQISQLNDKDNQQRVSIRAVKLMIQSDNNQTKIVGAKLLTNICNYIYIPSSNMHRHNTLQPTPWIPLTYISSQTFHLTHLTQHIYTHLVKSLMDQVRRTHFKSCWLEMMSSLLRVLKNSIFVRELFKISGGDAVEEVRDFLGVAVGRRAVYLKEAEDQENIKAHMPLQSSHSQIIKNQIDIEQVIHLFSSIKKDTESLNRVEKYLQMAKKDSRRVLQLIQIEQLIYGSKQKQNKQDINSYKFPTLLQQIGQQVYLQYHNKKSTQLSMESLSKIQEYVLQLVYPLTKQLYKKYLKSNKLNPQLPIIKQVLYVWFKSMTQEQVDHGMGGQSGGGQCGFIWKVIGKYVFDQVFNGSLELESLIFKSLFVLKVLSNQQYISFITQQSKKQNAVTVDIKNQTVANMLTLLNLGQYFNRNTVMTNEQQKAREIEQINCMIQYVSKKCKCISYVRESVQIIFMDLIVIFSNYLQPEAQPNQKDSTTQPITLKYQDINQQFLLECFKTLSMQLYQNSNGKLDQIWEILSQESLKELIASYNYDSFGNYCFTLLLLFLIAGSNDRAVISVVFDEVIARYPFLFYYAAQHAIFGPQQMYTDTKRVVIEQMKDIYSMLIVGGKHKIDHKNIFIKYLTAQ